MLHDLCFGAPTSETSELSETIESQEIGESSATVKWADKRSGKTSQNNCVQQIKDISQIELDKCMIFKRVVFFNSSPLQRRMTKRDAFDILLSSSFYHLVFQPSPKLS